jgi:hypothetical protein
MSTCPIWARAATDMANTVRNDTHISVDLHLSADPATLAA